MGMSDDEGRLMIVEPDSPDNDRLVIASEDEVSDTELGRFLLEEDDSDIVIIDEISPAKEVNGSSSKKVKHRDPDVTPPYINGSVMDKNEEAIEDGEITDDDDIAVDDGMDQRTTNQHSSYRNSSHKSPTRSNRDSRESRDGRDEKREGRSNGSIGDSHSSRSGSSHAHSAASAAAAPPTSSHPHSRGAPGGVRSKPNPLSAPQTLSPAGHLRKSVDREKERKDRHKSIHSLHSSISSSTASGGSSSTPVVSTPLPPPPPPPSSSIHSLPPPSPIPSLPSSMALDVPPAVPSPAITEMMEKGEKKRETKENGERRERNGSVSSSTSSVRETKEEMTSIASSTSSIEEKKRENGRKREERSDKDGEQPPEKKRKHKEDRREKMEMNVNRETDEERTNNNPSPPSVFTRGTSVDVQADREDAILNLPAGSSVTLTFTVCATVGSGEPDGGLNTMYISAMIGGREWMGCISDGDGGRRRSVASSASSEDGRKVFRGNGSTARDKRARNGVERKRRNQVDNDEEDGNSHDSTSAGEGTSTGQRITLIENGNKREMHHCVIDNCDFRFSSMREMEYHKLEMHNKKKVMKEDLASQTDFISPFLTPHFSIECQTDDVVVRTKEEIEEEKKMRIKEKEEDEKKWKEEEKKKKETQVKIERSPTPVEPKPNGVLTIQTGTRPSIPIVSSGAPEGTLLMKASPISIPITAATSATPTATAARGAETGGTTHKIHAPIAIAPSIASSSSSMPTLTPAVSTPSTPTASKPPRVGGGSGGGPSVPSPRTLPLVPPQLPPGLFPNGLPNAAAVGSPAQAQAMQMQQMQQMMAVQQQQQMALMQQHAAAQQHQQQQQKAAAASNTQHKINELKAKDDSGPSTSSGIAPHPSMSRPTVAPSMTIATPQTPQRPPQMQQQPQFPAGFQMMPMMNPAAAQQVMQHEFMRQMYLSTLMNQGQASGQQQQQQQQAQQAHQQQQQQMQPNFMQPSQSQMMMMQQLMMHAQQQQPK